MPRRKGPTVGQGDVYSYIEPGCYNALMNVLNDPNNEWYELLQKDSGMSIAEIRSALGELQYDSTYDVYYDPNSVDSKWDLMGDYGELAAVLEDFGIENGVDCGLGVITIINSHQGVGGL